MRLDLEEVPPPKAAPVDQIGETLGLVRGLRPRRNDLSPFRCGNCFRWVKTGDWAVPVPDGIRSTHAEDIEEAARLNAYNGHFTSWCLSCAPKKPRAERIKAGLVKWWQFWK